MMTLEKTIVHDGMSYDERRPQIDTATDYVMNKCLIKKNDLKNDKALATVGGFIAGMIFSLLMLRPEIVTFFLSRM
jgi:tetrahydromethanopterin S-methyltransferase subunit F